MSNWCEQTMVVKPKDKNAALTDLKNCEFTNGEKVVFQNENFVIIVFDCNGTYSPWETNKDYLLDYCKILAIEVKVPQDGGYIEHIRPAEGKEVQSSIKRWIKNKVTEDEYNTIIKRIAYSY